MTLLLFWKDGVYSASDNKPDNSRKLHKGLHRQDWSNHSAPFAATWRSWWYYLMRARRPKPA
jgi:hypothetical protein